MPWTSLDKEDDETDMFIMMGLGKRGVRRIERNNHSGSVYTNFLDIRVSGLTSKARAAVHLVTRVGIAHNIGVLP